MPKKSSAGKLVSVSATRRVRSTGADLKRLRSAMAGSVDTSEIAEQTVRKPLRRDADGVLPQRKSAIRDAIEKRRKQLGLTPYRLWKLAIPFHGSLSQSAVHEFLKGQRQLELPSAEALLAAVDLHVVEHKRPAAATRTRKKCLHAAGTSKRRATTRTER